MDDVEGRGYIHIGKPGDFNVVFIEESGKRLVKSFQSPYLARKFVNKIRHSRKCTLISYPNFG